MQLKRALGWTPTVLMQSLEQDLSPVPAGMISEWGYNVSRDKYTFPVGSVEQDVLDTFEAGAAVSKNVSRVIIDSRQNCYIRRTDPAEEGSITWKYSVKGGAFITHLRFRAVSSTSSTGNIRWEISGGSVPSRAENIDPSLLVDLGSQGGTDLSDRVYEWTWLQISVKIIGDPNDAKDAQLFRSPASNLVDNQWSVKLGLSLSRDGSGPRDVSEVESALRACARCRVGRLGETARQLMAEAEKVES